MKLRGSGRRKPVLIVQHAPHEHPAAVRRALERQGTLIQWIHPYRGDAYPGNDEIAGIISLGGAMGANDEDDHPWILPELKLLRDCVKRELPVAGICLGGQMLARALGGRVEKHHVAEIGWFPLELSAAGVEDPILGAAGECPTLYQFHNDTFFPPSDAVLLARSEICERQAYRVGENAYGFQFHPEVDIALIEEWLAVPGTETEINAALKKHGSKSVQDPSTQRRRAREAEEFSLKLSAAIAKLFKD